MTRILITPKGRCYKVAWMGTLIVLWRPICDKSEARKWPEGIVFRVVSIPNSEQPDLCCSCEFARFHPAGAWACPHGLLAISWLAGDEQTMGVQGGVSPFAGGAGATVSPHCVRGDVTGLVSPSVSPRVLENLPPVPLMTVSKEGP